MQAFAGHYDVIVIGAGAMGSAATYYLASQGRRVLTLDRYSPPHEFGSHSGQSRIIRKAYFEHPDYVPLLNRSYFNWNDLEKECGEKIYFPTGIFYFGSPDHPTMKGVKYAAEKFHLELESGKNQQVFTLPENFETLFEPDAGFLRPELAIQSYLRLSIDSGAIIKTNETVNDWKILNDRIEISSSSGYYTADKLIVTAGSWTSQLIPPIKNKLSVTEQILGWVLPKSPEKFMLNKFPCWFIEDPELGMFYGFPMLDKSFGGPVGLKLASHKRGNEIDPDASRSLTKKEEIEKLRYVIDKYLPDAHGDFIETKSCLYTYSPDENFIIDHLPGTNRLVTIACGFSGHGFKFASAVGEILADLAMKGTTDQPIDFLRLHRFD